MDKKLLIWAITSVVLTGLGAGVYFGIISKITNVQNVDTKKVYHIGILSALEYFVPIIEGFKQEMTKLGYVEGKNVVYDIQKGPTPVGNQKIIEKFVLDKVDLILVYPTEASIETKEITKGTEIPVISVAISTEGNNLVDSIQSPGGNLTGVRFPIPEVATKRLEILHELAPKAKRIIVPYLKGYPTVIPALEALESVEKSFGVTLIGVPFSTPDEVTSYLNDPINSSKIDAILTIPEPISILPPFINQIYEFADKNKIPVAGAIISDNGVGPAFSLIPSGFEMGRLAAPLADKIFKGTDPGTIPIVTPESVLEINYKVIQKLNLTASESLLRNAKRILR